MREKYESLALADLKEIAKSRGIRSVSTMKKSEVVDAMLALDEEEKKQRSEGTNEAAKPATVNTASMEGKESVKEREATFSELDSGITACGILEVMPDGFGFFYFACFGDCGVAWAVETVERRGAGCWNRCLWKTVLTSLISTRFSVDRVSKKYAFFFPRNSPQNLVFHS